MTLQQGGRLGARAFIATCVMSEAVVVAGPTQGYTLRDANIRP
jgi:hypothetical protein